MCAGGERKGFVPERDDLTKWMILGRRRVMKEVIEFRVVRERSLTR
jgi:hypothetical protein